jgi:outer membrane protein
MKKMLLALALVAASPLAMAGKIAVFDPQGAILLTDKAKKLEEKLKADKEFSKLIANAENARSQALALQKDFEKNGMTWSAEQQAEHKKKLQNLTDDFQLAQKKIQAENQSALAELEKEMGPKLQPIMEAYIKEKDIDLLVNPRAVMFAKPELDITKEIAARLDQAK